jgi:hypothetical protein
MRPLNIQPLAVPSKVGSYILLDGWSQWVDATLTRAPPGGLSAAEDRSRGLIQPKHPLARVWSSTAGQVGSLVGSIAGPIA